MNCDIVKLLAHTKVRYFGKWNSGLKACAKN